jgi:hypothetical protein
MKPHITRVSDKWIVVIEYEDHKLFTDCDSFARAAKYAFMISHIGRYDSHSLNYRWHKQLDYGLLDFLEFRELVA